MFPELPLGVGGTLFSQQCISIVSFFPLDYTVKHRHLLPSGEGRAEAEPGRRPGGVGVEGDGRVLLLPHFQDAATETTSCLLPSPGSRLTGRR